MTINPLTHAVDAARALFNGDWGNSEIAIGVGLMNWVPEMSITDAPFLWKSREQCYKAIAGAFGAQEAANAAAQAAVTTGPRRSDTQQQLLDNEINAAKARVDALATQIQPAQRDAIERAATGFRTRALDARANTPPTMAQAAP